MEYLPRFLNDSVLLERNLSATPHISQIRSSCLWAFFMLWYHACFLSYSCPLGEKRQITFKLPRLIRNPRRLDAHLCAAGSKKCADSIAVKSLGNRTAPAPPYFCASYSGTETLDPFAYKRKWTNAMATLDLVRKGDDGQKKLGTQICCASQHDTQVCLSSRHDLSLHLYSPTMLMLPNGITQCNLLSQ